MLNDRVCFLVSKCNGRHSAEYSWNDHALVHLSKVQARPRRTSELPPFTLSSLCDSLQTRSLPRIPPSLPPYSLPLYFLPLNSLPLSLAPATPTPAQMADRPFVITPDILPAIYDLRTKLTASKRFMIAWLAIAWFETVSIFVTMCSAAVADARLKSRISSSLLSTVFLHSFLHRTSTVLPLGSSSAGDYAG